MLGTQATPLPYLIDSQRMAKALVQAMETVVIHREEILAATERSIGMCRAKRPPLYVGLISDAPSFEKSVADIAVDYLDCFIMRQQRLLEQFMCSEKAWISTNEMRLLCDIEQGCYQDRLTTYGITRHDLF